MLVSSLIIELLTISPSLRDTDHSVCLDEESLYSGLTFYNMFHDIHCVFACFVQKDIQTTFIVIVIVIYYSFQNS